MPQEFLPCCDFSSGSNNPRFLIVLKEYYLDEDQSVAVLIRAQVRIVHPFQNP